MNSDLTNGRNKEAQRLVAADLLEQAGDSALADLLRQLAGGAASVSMYAVTGSTGEYDDWTEWTVQTYLTQADAEAHAKRGNDWLMEVGCHSDQQDPNGDYETMLPASPAERHDTEEACPHDDRLRIDYTGTSYHVKECTLKLDA